MCQNATKTAASLMAAIKPTLVNLLTLEGIASTPDGVAALNAYDAAEEAVAAWMPGTTAQTVIELINAFTSVFNTLPISALVKTLADLISAGIVTVIGVLTANSPAPATTAAESAPATEEETQAMHQANVIADTSEKVTALVPGFKRAIFTSPSHQYTSTWNGKVDEVSAKIGALKQ